jgi:hypothetical protein
MSNIKSHFRKWIIILSMSIIPCLLILNMGQSHAAEPVAKQKGMTFGSWSPGGYSAPDADQALSELRDDGVDWISLLVTWYQDTYTSTTIYAAPNTPTDEDLLHAINQAHSLGMKVMLKPHLDLANDSSHWRGDIGIGFSESDWITWFASYKTFIYHYAQLAQADGADQFCVGTELVSTEFHAADWRSVIAGVRGLFTRQITYAANQSSEPAISWWDKVDFIGVDAYYSLTNKNDPTIEELKAAWAPRVAALKTLSQRWGKPILFTEIGYSSQDGANQHPCCYVPGLPIDLQEQADLYQALFESFYNQTWFAGVFWFWWLTDPFQGGPCDLEASPHDKPAEGVMRAWFGAPPKQERIPGLDYARTLPAYTDELGAGWENQSWGGSYDFASTEQVASGTYAISATAEAWGTVVLQHENFDSSPYYWLELYVYKSSDASSLKVYATDGNDQMLRTRPVEYCRYTDDRPITPGIWTRVRIPLNDLNASNRMLQRLSIANNSDTPFTFYVDELRLVGALWKTFLPVILKR